ncbi:unnamed protein product [Pelagomonas calceolata]|uniref:Uncharacterized protein n=1 Tax=Pelagomonas calceolata TaxID=35677 RepID=A0A8J2SBZ4_9STRA|nr:unnamed protein product [Pelagomonas calceolata]
MPRQSLTALLPLASAILHTQTPPQSFHALPRDHLYRAFDGLIVDASPRGPLHDGDASNEKAMWLLDAFEASGKPVALAVDGVCDEAIEHQTLTRIGVCDPYEPFVSLRERLWPRTREERRRAARARAPAVVGPMAAAALGRAVVDDYMRNDASYVSDALREHLHRVFARVGRRCCGLAAGAGDHAALLDVLRARPVAFREAARDEQGVEASCLIATGGDLVWDTQGGNDGFVSLSEFEQLRGEDAVDAFLETELSALVRQGVPLLAFDGEHRQLERRGVAHTAAVYRALGGDAEEVGFLGDDALLLRCAVDELVRRGARAERILVLSAKDRPCRAAESYGMATAFLGGGEGDYVGLDEAWDPAL